MQLTSPWALLALLSVPLILILYSLRPKRRVLLLSSNRLWREALRERRRGFGLQKLLRDLSLILLLLLALVLSLGLSGPQWLTRTSEGSDVVLVLDVSASMQTRGGDGDRFALAKRQAETLLAGLADGSRMAIMSSGRNPLLHSAFESDKELLRGVLDGLRPRDEAGRPRAALALALALLRNRDRGRVVFLTDGAFDADPISSPLIDYRQVGGPERARNIAITRFDFRPEIGTERRFQMLLTVHNYTADEVSVPTAVSLNDSRLWAESLSLPPGGERTVVLPLRGRGVGQARAVIEANDDLAADNQAFAVLEPASGWEVLLVGPGNFYLESVLGALPNVRLTTRSDSVDVGLARLARSYDLIVLDRVPAGRLPRAGLPPGRYLLVDTVAPGLPFSAAGSVDRPLIVGNGPSALVRRLDLSGVKIAAARRLTLGSDPGLWPLFWSEQTVLALALLQNRGDDGLGLVYLGFDLHRSNFPLQTAFPLFIRRSLNWLSPRRDEAGSASTQLATGETFTIETPAADSAVIVGTPAGEALIYHVDDATLRFDATAEAGIYRYRVGEVERAFAVNLTDRRESDVNPRAELPAARGARTAARDTAQLSLALWPYLTVAALILLTLEWCLWCARRGSA